MKCSQCNSEAMYEIQGHLLCLEHYTMLSNNLRAQQIESMAMMNYLSDSIDRVFGLPPSGPRIEIPHQAVLNSPMTFNHIQIDRSVVGAINTAQVARIDVAMQNIRNQGNEDVSKAIKSLTEAIINDKQANKTEKNQILEQLTFLAEQATLPKSQQQKSVIKMVIKAIPSTLNTISSFSNLWSKWGATIEEFFKHL